MTLDEAIKHAEEVAKQNEEDAIIYSNCKNHKKNLCEIKLVENAEKRCCKCAEEHRQLAEWLKELKQLREQTRWTPCSKKPPEPFKPVFIQDFCGDYDLARYIPPRIKPQKYPNGYWGEIDSVDYDYFDVEAWYPLPEEYHPEGDKDEKN